MICLSLPTQVGDYPWGHSALHAHNVHSKRLRSLERGCYCVLNNKRRSGTPTWCFCSTPCKLHYLLPYASRHTLCLHVHTHFGCQLVNATCGFLTPTPFLSANKSVWIMQIQQVKNESTGSEQYGTSQVSSNNLFKECHDGEVRVEASSTGSRRCWYGGS